MPLPWRVALRTRTALAVYTLAGTYLAHVLSGRLGLTVNAQSLIQLCMGFVGMGATALALLGRSQAPVRDIPRLQKLLEEQGGPAAPVDVENVEKGP